MTDLAKLPRGIRNNNPGNLRAGYGLKKEVPKQDGFAHFESVLDGLQSMAALTFDYYHLHGRRTLKTFIGHYAPSSENDVTAYVRGVGLRLAISPLKFEVYDLRLDQGMRAFDFIRAMITQENGNPPTDWFTQPEWITPLTLLNAMDRTGHWPVL